jgi:hypothetical protein
MEERRFDNLTRRLAASTSRRSVLKALVVSAAASALGALGGSAAAQGKTDAAHFCASVFPPGPNRGKCVSDAAHGGGLYAQCGGNPANVCSGPNGPFCPDFSSEPSNCGGCGMTCASDESCSNGSCVSVCQPSTSECNGQCVDLSQDPNNCGTCGNVCTGGQICSAGVCGCPVGQVQCNGGCMFPICGQPNQVFNVDTCKCECAPGRQPLKSNGFCAIPCASDADCGNVPGACATTPEGDQVCADGFLVHCTTCSSSVTDCQQGCFAVNAICDQNQGVCRVAF